MYRYFVRGKHTVFRNRLSAIKKSVLRKLLKIGFSVPAESYIANFVSDNFDWNEIDGFAIKQIGL